MPFGKKENSTLKGTCLVNESLVFKKALGNKDLSSDNADHVRSVCYTETWAPVRKAEVNVLWKRTPVRAVG